MKVLITMAGDSTRFKEAGVHEEKYRLQVRDRTMFEWAMQSLEAFFDQEFVFVAREEHDAREFIAKQCADLGIDAYHVVELDERTSGQAATALAAAEHIDSTDAVEIYNIDTYVEEGNLTPEGLRGDGCIPVFEASGDSWSFAKVDDARNVTAVSEKEPISNLASLGLYHFDEWQYFVDAFERAASDVESEYGERYIAPLYNALIEDDHQVTVDRVSADDVHILGTPSDVAEFDEEFASRHGLDL
jgi:dTDP-glucose pyrophosphorylase